MEKEITKIQESIDIISKTTAYILENMATKNDLINLELKLTTEIQDFRSDFKSFKKDINDDMKEIKNDVVDIDDTSKHYDKRIEKLEDKIFA